MTPERRTSTLNNARSVVSLDTTSSFHLIDYQRFCGGSCHSVVMVRTQVTKVICSKILIKDWLIIFIAVFSPQADHGGKQTTIYRVIFKLKASSDKPRRIYSIKHENYLLAIDRYCRVYSERTNRQG